MKKALFILLSLALAFAFFAGYSPAQASKDQIKLKVFVHYPNPPGKPVPVSNCTPTDTSSDNYKLTGLVMPSTGVNYAINYNTKPINLSAEQVTTAISNSFATWHSADSGQIFHDMGSTTVKAAKLDGTNAILFKGISGSAIAITYVWYYPSTGQLAEVDTAFNKNLKWSYTPYTTDCGGAIGTYDVQNIGTHEFGHWIGLDDLYKAADKDLTMYGYGDLQELKKDSLGTGDITGVISIAP